MIAYKFTDKNVQTRGGMQWVIGEKKTTSGIGELCSEGWLHSYCDALLANFIYPIHIEYESYLFFECEIGGIIQKDGQLKQGSTELTLIKEIPIPKITLTQRVAFGILCAKKVCHDESWDRWADKWLSCEGRTARAAARAAEATRAAEEEEEAEAARAARAAEAASVTARDETKIDFIEIATQAMEIKL